MATSSKATKIGKYDVIDIIGRGGMGVVYQAKDPVLDRLVAIKMMNVDVHENADFLERFYREAKSTASLRHPNIVTVYDLGEYQNRPFLVMEYLEGNSLESLLRTRRPMTVVEKINIIIEICQGLGYAHQRGVIHRDIKPANIMVSNDGSVKIVDFGIARLGDNTLTRTGQVVGSLYYMPPEQLRDKPIDSRADIYSTGVVLYQLLTYALPFEGESTGSTLAKIVSDDPRPFSQFAVDYPSELEAVTLKALAKERDQRFATAEAFAAALVEVLDGFKQASIQEYLEKAESLQQSNALKEAQECLLKVLKLDRQHAVAAKQLSALRARVQAQITAERVRYLKEQAEEAYARDEFDAALGFLNQALELDNNPGLQAFRTSVEKAKGEAEVVRGAVARAEAAQRSGDLDGARNAIESARTYRPNDSKIRVLSRAIERDLEERERQRQVEGLLDQARKQMSGRKFTAALDLLREAQKLDPATPQLRILLERLAAEHQQERQRRELEQFNREIQDAIDRDDYKAASGRAAEALGRFPNETSLTRLKELADTQIEIAAQREFVRNQTVAGQQLLDSGQTQQALDVVEKALQKVPGNSRLESLRMMIQDQLLKERNEADKATCLRQANEAISLGRYADAIQILEGAQLRFVDTPDVDELLRFARDQQSKARRQAAIEEALRGAHRLLAEQHFDGAVDLLEKTAGQTPSEDLDVLLAQARDQRDSFRKEVEGAIAKGRGLLEEGAVANAREFLNSRPASYRQSAAFRGLLEEAESTPIPASEAEPPSDTSPEATTEPPKAEAETFPTQPAMPRRRGRAIVTAALVLIILSGFVAWLLFRPREAILSVKAKAGALVSVDGTARGSVPADGNLVVKVSSGSHAVRVNSDGFQPWSGNITVKPGEQLAISSPLAAVTPPGPPAPSPVLGNLSVKTNIDSAEVFIDGNLKGLTGRDKKFQASLTEGKHRVQAKKRGYEDSSEQEVEISAAKKQEHVSFALGKSAGLNEGPSTDAYLNIYSKPGALIRIDGIQQDIVGPDGTRVIKVTPGSHRIEVSLDNFEPWSGSVVVKAGSQQPVRPALVAKAVPPPVMQPASIPPPAITSFGASQETIEQGHSTRLNWSIQNATDASLDHGIGPVPLSGTREISPSDTTTYTLTARGSGGTRTATLHVIVNAPPPVGSSDVDGIREALSKFKDIYEGMVAEDLQTIWPSISKRQIDAIKNANKGAQSLRLTDMCPGSPKISADTAELTCSESMTYVRNGKRQPPLVNPMTFKFKKIGGKWVVDSRHG